MRTADEATAEPVTILMRREWRRFRSRGRLIAMTAATLLVILLGVAFAFVPSSYCGEGPVDCAGRGKLPPTPAPT